MDLNHARTAMWSFTHARAYVQTCTHTPVEPRTVYGVFSGQFHRVLAGGGHFIACDAIVIGGGVSNKIRSCLLPGREIEIYGNILSPENEIIIEQKPRGEL